MDKRNKASQGDSLKSGYTLLEVLIVVAVIGVLAGLVDTVLSQLAISAQKQRLYSDVGTINRAILTFVANGGEISRSDSVESVIAKLKTSRVAANAKHFVGYTGKMIDPRLGVLSKTAEDTGVRAVFDPTTASLRLTSDNVAGVSRFTLDKSNSILPADRPVRSDSVYQYAKNGNWIWDYEEGVPTARNGVTTVSISSAPNTVLPVPPPPPPPAVPVPLDPPLFSIPSGFFSRSDYPLNLTLRNPNSSGEIFYRLDYSSSWQLYSGIISISGASPVQAYVAATSSAYLDSLAVGETYQLRNNPPNAENDLFSAVHNQVSSFDLFINDSDPDSDAFTVVDFVVGGVNYIPGEIAYFSDGWFTVSAQGTATLFYSGNVSNSPPVITYRISDGSAFDSAYVTINVAAPPARPLRWVSQTTGAWKGSTNSYLSLNVGNAVHHHRPNFSGRVEGLAVEAGRNHGSTSEFVATGRAGTRFSLSGTFSTPVPVSEVAFVVYDVENYNSINGSLSVGGGTASRSSFESVAFDHQQGQTNFSYNSLSGTFGMGRGPTNKQIFIRGTGSDTISHFHFEFTTSVFSHFYGDAIGFSLFALETARF